jgi:hypothetical protein
MAADKDRDGGDPPLELPSFGLRRKKKRAEPAPVVEPIAPPAAVAEPELEPIVEPEPIAEPVTARQPVDLHDTALIEQDAAEPAAPPAPKRVKEKRERRPVRLPALPGLTAALVTGLLVGLVGVLATFASLRLCEVVKGTPSCGGPGLFLLVAILVAMVYLGGWLLRGFGVHDPGSTSFLAVGLTAVVAMLFLVDVLFAWWMVIAIPLVSMAAHALSWWVTTSAAGVEIE